MGGIKKIKFIVPESGVSSLTYKIDTSGYGEFEDYILDRMGQNKPIALKVVDPDKNCKIVIHPAFYAQYLMEIHSF